MTDNPPRPIHKALSDMTQDEIYELLESKKSYIPEQYIKLYLKKNRPFIRLELTDE